VEPLVLTTVTVTPASATMMMGTTQQLTAQALDQNGAAMSGRTFTWSSSDEDVATVSSSGEVTAVNGGSVTFTAMAEGKSGSAAVTIDTPTLSSDWVGAVNWDNAVVVEVGMVENGAALSYSLSQSSFVAGTPYIIRITNPATNTSKHYFSPKDALGSFYQAVATRKAQTGDAEYKAPYFNAVELKIGGTLELYIVPVVPGTYTIICTITGHEAAGMTAPVTITGGTGYALDLEVAADFNTALDTDPRRSGSHVVWTTAVDVPVAMEEGASTFTFIPPDVTFTKDSGYKIILSNASDHASKHYYTAADFYKTVVLRKADDTDAEIKAPYLRAVELLIGGSTTLFLVPTVANTFDVLCTISGHAAAGMTGTLTVDP
jgi:uncharacterized cupredoxin-like copper-binding protein